MHSILRILLAVSFVLAVQPLSAATAQSLRKTSLDFREIAKQATPAVVSIKVKGSESADSDFDSDEETDQSDYDLWQRFFGYPKNSRRGPRQQEDIIGQASGFIISPDGYILTNSHVVKDMKEITVIMNSGREYAAKVIGQDPSTDVALVKIEAKDLPFLKLGDSNDLEVGEWVVAIGNPMGLQASLTAGVVSAKGRNNLDLTRIEDFIQTDAAINRGNSGGPLLTLDNEVVGMNTAIVTNSDGRGNMGIGFAIPSNILKVVTDDLKATGSFKRGFMGVTLQPVDSNLAQAFGIEGTEGALIAEVAKNSPAEKAGLKQGDIILKFNGRLINDVGGLRNAVAVMKPGSKVSLVVLRNNKNLNIDVEIGNFPATAVTAASSKNRKIGVQVENVTPELASKMGLTQTTGVLISAVQTNSPLTWAGIRKGALILEVNKKPVNHVEEFNRILDEADPAKPILFLIKQGESTRYVSIKNS